MRGAGQRIRSTYGKRVNSTYGRARWQRLWKGLHRRAILGMNYGRPGVGESGEVFALEHARSAMPDAEVVFDVGANVGDWTAAARAVWPGARFHAFEPAAETFERLRSRFDGVSCIRAACGDETATATLYEVGEDPRLSSLHERSFSRGDVVRPGETVEVITLDEYCAEQGIERIGFLKIDTEGHELAVLRGAASLLERRAIRFIQFEFGGTNIDSRTYLRDFVELLEPDYRLGRLLSDGLDPLDYTEEDEVFVTANFLAERVPGTRSRR